MDRVGRRGWKHYSGLHRHCSERIYEVSVGSEAVAHDIRGIFPPQLFNNILNSINKRAGIVIQNDIKKALLDRASLRS